MLKEGIYVIGFSYPVVPKGKARIRVQVFFQNLLKYQIKGKKNHEAVIFLFSFSLRSVTP